MDKPPESRRIWTRKSKIGGFWGRRLKSLIVSYIPHTVDIVENYSNGGLSRFIESAKKKRGQPYRIHNCNVDNYMDAFAYNTFEAMCYACMLDPDGDAEIIRSQENFRHTIEKWTGIFLDAQLDDGYLQNYVYLNDLPRWVEANKENPVNAHEDYLASYFIEASIAHFLMTDGKDRRMFNAALKMADLFVNTIGYSPKKSFTPDHSGLEQTLIRFAAFVEEFDGGERPASYRELAMYFLRERSRTQTTGNVFFQKKECPLEMREAYGHAVMAVYLFSAMAAMSGLRQGNDFSIPASRVWDDVINRKIYITGGVGSGCSDETFEEPYKLPVKTYAETCASCGMVFFSYNMGLTNGDAKYFDILERVLYNGVLGSVNLDGSGWNYTNPLESSGKRPPWMIGLCCMNNMTRTMLQIPTWMHMKDDDSIYVNLFVSGEFAIEDFKGGKLILHQETEYPWKGLVKIKVKPEGERNFSIRIRIPDRNDSKLYVRGKLPEQKFDIYVNGKKQDFMMDKGYAVISRSWGESDEISFTVPLAPVFVKADDRIEVCRGKVAIEYGPLVYNFEHADNFVRRLDYLKIDPGATMTTDWSDILDGIIRIRIKSGDEDYIAIPNYARNNRGGDSMVYATAKAT